MRRIDRLLVLALVAGLAGLNVAEIAAQVAPIPPFAAESSKPLMPKPFHDLIYSTWTKTCTPEGTKRLRFTGKVGRLPNGEATVTAVLFEQEGRSDKILRVMLPLGAHDRAGHACDR